MNKRKIHAIWVLSVMLVTVMLLTTVVTFSFISLTVQATNNSKVYTAKKLIIPAAYKKAMVVNLFKDTWSKMEDGSDKTGSIKFASNKKEFKDIYAYLNGLRFTKTDDIAPNFTADFSFTNGKSGENGYDFVFLDNQLIMRDPVGNCHIVNISKSKYNNLRKYIEKIRLAAINEKSPPGGYTANRAITKEELAMFQKVMKDLLGVKYEPTLVATQVVAGTNYRFTAKATPVVPKAKSKTVYVYIFKSLEGTAELVKIEDI